MFNYIESRKFPKINLLIEGGIQLSLDSLKIGS